MKRNLVLAAIFSLFLLAIAASAQTPDYSGTWTLDVKASKLGDRNNIESQTLTVKQTATDLTVTPATKRTPPPDGAGGGAGRMGGGGGDRAITYVLDGKEVKSEVEGRMGKMPVTTTAKTDGGKISISTSSTFTTPNGEMTTSNKETWSLSSDGKTLTINGERTSPRGTDSTTRVFTKS